MVFNGKSLFRSIVIFALRILFLLSAFFFIELLVYFVLKPDGVSPLFFGAIWSLLLCSVILILPRGLGRIIFGVVYFFSLLWALAQTGYYCVFNRMMWLSDIFYAGEGIGFFNDVLSKFPAIWWLGAITLFLLGILVIIKFPFVKHTVWNYCNHSLCFFCCDVISSAGNRFCERFACMGHAFRICQVFFLSSHLRNYV